MEKRGTTPKDAGPIKENTTTIRDSADRTKERLG
jgi:hypothetical protein